MQVFIDGVISYTIQPGLTDQSSLGSHFRSPSIRYDMARRNTQPGLTGKDVSDILIPFFKTVHVFEWYGPFD